MESVVQYSAVQQKIIGSGDRDFGLFRKQSASLNTR